jgi:hypothetical protein
MSTRNIKTVYYFLHEAVKVTHSVWANNAVPNAIGHMQVNQYEATHCEVYDVANGELHAVIKRNVLGDITILFKRTVKEGM